MVIHTVGGIVFLIFASHILDFALDNTGELCNVEFLLFSNRSSEHFLHFRIQLDLVRIAIAISL